MKTDFRRDAGAVPAPPLVIQTAQVHSWTQYRVSGFTDQELSRLKAMEYPDACDKIIEMMDCRNKGIGTVIRNQHVICRVQFAPDAVLIKTSH